MRPDYYSNFLSSDKDFELFWETFDKAIRDTNDLSDNEKIERLTEILFHLSPHELINFELLFRTYFLLLDNYRTIAYADMIDLTYATDDYEGFIYWIILKGREVFQKAILNPDVLHDFFADDISLAVCLPRADELARVSLEAFERRLESYSIPNGEFYRKFLSPADFASYFQIPLSCWDVSRIERDQYPTLFPKTFALLKNRRD